MLPYLLVMVLHLQQETKIMIKGNARTSRSKELRIPGTMVLLSTVEYNSSPDDSSSQYLPDHQEYGINSEKSAVVVWKNLP